MTDTINLKTKDICDALGIGRHQLRAWTDSLAPYSYRETKERTACRYDSADLLYFAVVKYIIETCGMSLSFIGNFSDPLYSCIREPNSLTAHQYLFITDKGTKCDKVNPEKISQEGILVDLQPARSLVFQFLGLLPHQTQLPLGLREVN